MWFNSLAMGLLLCTAAGGLRQHHQVGPVPGPAGGGGGGAAPPRPSELPGQVSNKSSFTTFPSLVAVSHLPLHSPPCRLKQHTTCRVQWRLGCPAPTPCCSEFGYCRSRRGGLGYCRLEIMWPKLLYIHLHYCKLVPCSLEHEIFIEIKCHRIEN